MSDVGKARLVSHGVVKIAWCTKAYHWWMYGGERRVGGEKRRIDILV